LLSILSDDRGRRFQPNVGAAALVDKGALRGNPPDDIFAVNIGDICGHPDTHPCKQCNL
jgi:hypothetical protein